jgi:hypothetical protein
MRVRIPETIDGPAVKAASPVGAVLDLLADIEIHASV